MTESNLIPGTKKKRHARLGKSLDRDIARLSRRGLSNRKIGKLLGVNHDSVGDRRKMMGLAQPVAAKIKDWKEVERLYVDQRLSTGTIGKLKGVSWSAIHQGLLRRGVAMRSLSLDKKIKDWNEVARLYVDQKLDLRSIAERYGVSAKSIETHLLEMGVTMRSSQQALMDWKSEQDRLAAHGKILTLLIDKPLSWKLIVPLLMLDPTLTNALLRKITGPELALTGRQMTRVRTQLRDWQDSTKNHKPTNL